MPGRFPLGRLHRALQVLFGWLDYHLHEFEIEGVAYTQAELREDLWEEHLDEAGVRLSELPDRLLYRYDMGDDWEVEVVVEERSSEDWLPLLLGGEHPGPPEDCGGLWGYAELNQVLRNPKHPEYRDMKIWAGRYHPDKFSLESLGKAWNRAFPPPKAKKVVVAVEPVPLDFKPHAHALEKYRLDKLTTRVTMLAALLERGRPMSLEELAARLQRAGLSLAHGLTTLKKAWKQEGIFQQRADGRLEVYREHPEMWRYEFNLSEALVLDDPLWATAPLRSDELGRLPTEWRREESVLAVLDTLADGVSAAELQAAVAEHGKKFQVDPVLALMPVSVRAGGLVMERQHPMIQNLRLRLRRKQAFWEERRGRVKVELPEAGWLLVWDADTIWARNLAGGPDKTFHGADRRDFLESVQVVYAPHILRLYEGLGIEARREVYRYDLMPLELYDGMRQYPAGSRFEDFLESTVGKQGFLLDRVEAYWRHGCEHGEVLLRRTEVNVWWDFSSDKFHRLRNPLLEVEF